MIYFCGMKRDTKIAIITFITLGVSGLAVLGAYKYIQKRKAKKLEAKKSDAEKENPTI